MISLLDRLVSKATAQQLFEPPPPPRPDLIPPEIMYMVYLALGLVIVFAAVQYIFRQHANWKLWFGIIAAIFALANVNSFADAFLSP